MYNGIGLTTPRGSGTNGHVQRNVAFVRPGKKDNVNYRTEDDLAKLDSQSNRQPNQGILDHERKRKIEVKCAELEEVLECQGRSQDEVRAKVELYRSRLMNQGTVDLPKDEFGRLLVRETHHIAQAQQEKNAKLRDAFGISEYFVEGTSFDQDRKAKEDLAKSEALQKELAEKEKVKEVERVNRKRYALVRTPSPEKQGSGSEATSRNGKRDRGDNDGARERTDDDEGNIGGKVVARASRNKEEKKKKKKKARDMSSSPNRKKDKKKKSKKNKKDRAKKKHSKKVQRNDDSDSTDTDSDSNSMASDALSSSERDSSSKRKKKSIKKKDKKKKSSKKKKAKSRSPFRVKSPMTDKKSLMEGPRGREDVHDEDNHHGDSRVHAEKVLHEKNKILNDRDRHTVVDSSRDHYITQSQSRGPRSYNRDDDSNRGYAFSGRSSSIRGGFQRRHNDHGMMQQGDENRERRSRSRHRRREHSVDRERRHKSRSRSESRRSRQHENRGSSTTERTLRRSRDRKRRDYTPQRKDKTERRHRELDHDEPNDAGRVPSECERQSDRSIDRHQRQRERDAERNRDRGRECERNPNRAQDHGADRCKERSSRSADKQQDYAPSNIWLRPDNSSKKQHVKSSPREPQRMDKSSATGSKKRNKSPELKQESTEKTRKRPENMKTMSPSALAPSQRSGSGIPDASLSAEKQLSSDDAASDLSYSPARRDPDRYHDILHQASAENVGNPEVKKMNGEKQTASFGSAVVDNERANRSASATRTYPNEEPKSREDDRETKDSDNESRSPRERPSRSRSRSIAPSAKSRSESSSTALNKQQLKQHISSSETKKTQAAAAAPEGEDSNSATKKSNNKLTSVSASSSTSKLRHSLRRDASRSPEVKKRRSDRDAIPSKEEIPPFKVGPRASRSDRSDRKFNNKRENEHETKLPKRVSSSPERKRTEILSSTGEGDPKTFKPKKTTLFAPLSSGQSHGTSTAVLQQPVVKLHSPESSQSSAESDDTDHGRDERGERGDNLDAFLPRYDDNREQEKDLSLLKALKNDLAAKAKQSLEKKKNVCESIGASGAIMGVLGLVGKSADVSSTTLVESRIGESRERELQMLHTKQQPLDPTSSNTFPDSASAVITETLPMPSSTTMSTSTALEAASNNTNNAAIKKEIHEIISTVGACAVADGSEATTKKTTILQAVDNILKEKISGKPNKNHKQRTTTRSSRSKSHSRSRSRSQKSRSYSSSSSDTCSSRSRSRSSSSHSRSSSGRGSSRSRSRSSSPSTRSSVARSRTGSRSPSIPRRAGSPSFLDRRRITRPSIYRSRSRGRHVSDSRKRRSKKSRSRSSSDSSSCSSRSSRSHRFQSKNEKHRRQPQRRDERSRSRENRPRSVAAHASFKSSRREHPERFARRR